MLPKRVQPTASQKLAIQVAHVGFATACPFFAHLFYSELEEYITDQVPTAATDGKRIFLNPTYFEQRKPPERIFILAHEVLHWVYKHCQRMKSYKALDTLRGHPWDKDQFNIAADYVINALLISEGIGLINPAWLYDPRVHGEMVVEDVYELIYKDPPKMHGGRTGANRDKEAEGNGGQFDELFEPYVDPVTGAEDVPTEAQFKEALVRAATAAKAVGKLPGSLQRLVDEMVEPQVDWREHIRMEMLGHVGGRRESWDRLNRRRLVLSPMMFLPGKRGYGAENVVVVIDNSGSVDDDQLKAFFSEVGGIVQDIRPRQVTLIWCDASIKQVDQARTLDELSHIRVKGAPGGGGTNFCPPFEYLKDHEITPETLVYITDGYGNFGDEPKFPVVWCINNDDVTAPWGDVVRIKM